jgi:hypothetical protein
VDNSRGEKKSYSIWQFLSLFSLSLLSLAFVYTVFAYFIGGGSDISLARGRLLALSSGWSEKLLSTNNNLEELVTEYGFEWQVTAFQNASASVMSQAGALAEKLSQRKIDDPIAGDDITALEALSVALFPIKLRLLAWTLINLPLLLLAVVIGGAYGVSQVKVSKGEDLFARCAGGGIFDYKVKLPPLDSEPLPGSLVLLNSDNNRFYKINDQLKNLLSAFGLTSKALELVARSFSQFATTSAILPKEEEDFAKTSNANFSLIKMSEVTLFALLELKAEYQQGRRVEESPSYQLDPDQLNSEELFSKNSAQLSVMLSERFHSVLSSSLRIALLKISDDSLALLILAIQLAKFEIYKNKNTSCYERIDLIATLTKSILTSIPHKLLISGETSEGEILLIRRALSSVGGSLLVEEALAPAEFSHELRALWGVIAIAALSPEEWSSFAIEIELIQQINELAQRFSTHLFDEIIVGSNDFFDGTYATPQHLFVPLRKLISIFKKTSTKQSLSRMEELIESLTASFPAISDEHNERRIYQAISRNDAKTLAEQHGVFETEIKEWSTLRIVLKASGWLAEEVRGSNLPKNNLCFSLFTVAGKGKSDHFGRRGIVALAGEYFLQRWGKQWFQRLPVAELVEIADNRESFEKLLKEHGLGNALLLKRRR